MVRSTRSTAVNAPNRLTTPRAPTITRPAPAALLLLQLVPLGLDVGAKPGLEGLRSLGGHRLVVHVRHVPVEVRPHPTGELDGQLGGRSGRALHLVLRRDREQAALHEHLLPAL